MSGFDFTDKAQANVAAAIKLAKDYSNPQVLPIHLAFVLLNEGAGEASNGKPQQSLFASVIQKAGGETVCTFPLIFVTCSLTHFFAAVLMSFPTVDLSISGSPDEPSSSSLWTMIVIASWDSSRMGGRDEVGAIGFRQFASSNCGI